MIATRNLVRAGVKLIVKQGERVNAIVDAQQRAEWAFREGMEEFARGSAQDRANAGAVHCIHEDPMAIDLIQRHGRFNRD